MPAPAKSRREILQIGASALSATAILLALPPHLANAPRSDCPGFQFPAFRVQDQAPAVVIERRVADASSDHSSSACGGSAISELLVRCATSRPISSGVNPRPHSGHINLVKPIRQ